MQEAIPSIVCSRPGPGIISGRLEAARPSSTNSIDGRSHPLLPCRSSHRANVIPEDATNHGRIDLTIHWTGRAYLLEFKAAEPSEPGRALEQLQTCGYHQKYAGQPVTLIGMEFSRAERNLIGFEWRRLG